ncbi:MAG: type III polyketide synthase [Cytophagales bacterium]|nr:type III polyketide synthase [Cytophagales bacterium]
MSYITAIGVANPSTRIAQPVIADFMVHAMSLGTTDARKLRALFRASGILHRHTVIEDYGRSHFSFFSEDPHHRPGTKARASLYQQHAPVVSAQAARQALTNANFHVQEITHLITISCTGMYAPGLDIDLIKLLGLRTDVQRTCINFMGCYAAFNGLRVADSICQANPAATVLVVCTELCSIHFQNENTEDNLLANALFADGAAALIVTAHPKPGINFHLLNLYSDIALQGEQEMAWKIGDTGFEMRLSSYVPNVITAGIRQLVDTLLHKSGIKLADIHYFAPHPGGLKILKVIEDALGITRAQQSHAYQVLQHYGNMSSATVVFVLQELLKTLTQSDHNKTVVSFAFGPGLTLESMLLKVSVQS